MPSLPQAQLCHIGLYATDLEEMVEFYTRILGLEVTDRGHSARGFDIVFLSRNADEHHQVAIASGRPKEATFSTVNQVSFRVNDLDELRTYFQWVQSQGVDNLHPRNHGNAWSVYFSDPEGNRLEIYCRSPWHVSQPFGEPLDLTEPAETILAKTEALVRADPTGRPMAEWSAELRKKLEPVA